jgi:type III secretory pathway component EscR
MKEYLVTIIRIIGFIVWLPIIIVGLVIAQILAWFKI